MGFDEAYNQRKSFRSFRGSCFFIDGNTRFTSWKPIAGHAIALFGLISFSHMAYKHWIVPTYQTTVKPGLEKYTTCMRFLFFNIVRPKAGVE
jgi:hypothetical protein